MLFLAAAVHAGWPLPAQSQAASPLRVTLLPPPVDGGLVVQVSDPAGQPLAGDRIERIEVMSANTLLAGVTQWDVVRGARQAQGGELRVEYRPPALPARQFFVAREIPPAEPPVVVTNAAQLRNAAGLARPGTAILLGPGTYPGGFFFTNLQGTEAAPIVIGALDPQNPPVIQGGANGIQLTDPAHLELRDLILRGATGNRLNIDDGGSFNTPAHHLILRRQRMAVVGPTGNRDGIK